MVLLAAPVAQTPIILTAIAPHLTGKIVVTDVGSTKSDVAAYASKILGKKSSQFVPGQDHQFIKAPVKTRVVVPVQIIPGLVAALQENYRMYQEAYGPAKGPMH